MDSKPSLLTTFLLPFFIFFCFILYANTLHYEFVFDDFRVISQPSLEQFANRLQNPNRWIVNLSFYLQKFIFGDFPAAYRIFNILFHGINAYLVFLLLQFISIVLRDKEFLTNNKSLHGNVLLALLFASHPLATQSVTYISQRFNILAAFFFLATCCLYLLFHSKGKIIYLILAIISSICAYLSKEFTVSLILIIFLLHYILKQNGKTKPTPIGAFIALLICSCLIPIIHFTPSSNSNDSLQFLPSWAPESIGRMDYLLTQLHVFYQKYLFLFFWPSQQNIDHDFTLVKNISIHEILLLSMYIGILLYSFLQRKKHPLLLLSTSWILFTLAPTSSLVPNSEIVAEHRFYIPSIGLLILFLYFTKWQMIRLKHAVLLVLIILLSITTWQRNQVWQSEETLWRDALAKSPNLYRPHFNMAGILMDQSNYPKALLHIDQALLRQPENDAAIDVKGRILEKMGRPQESAQCFQKIIKKHLTSKNKPLAFYHACNGMAILLYQNKQYQDALGYTKILFGNHFKHHEAHRLNTYIYLSLGQKDKALNHYQEAIKRNVSFPPEVTNELTK